MKKIFALILTAAMIVSAFVITASAENLEWTVYARAWEYDNPDTTIRNPGMRYTSEGVQMYTPEKDELYGAPLGTIQSTNKISYKNGLKMTVTVDSFLTDDSDRWICLSIWDSQMIAPAAAGRGYGWQGEFRPSNYGENGTDVTILSRMCNYDTPAAVKGLVPFTHSTYQGEQLVLEIRYEGGEYAIYVNDINMNANEFDGFMDNHEAYIGVTVYQSTANPFAITINEVNGTRQTGTASVAPYIPENLVKEEPLSFEDTPVVPDGEPCLIFDSTCVKEGSPGQGMTSIENDDGSLRLTFTNVAPIMSKGVGLNSYRAEEFPIFAVMYNDLDELGNQMGVLFYCSDTTTAPKSSASIPVLWTEFDCREADGWKIFYLDLSDESQWSGRINMLRLDLASNEAMQGESADFMWFGLFRTVEDVFSYADMHDVYEEQYGTGTPVTSKVDDNVTSAEQPVDTKVEEEVTNDTSDSSVVTEEEKGSSGDSDKSGSNTLWIVIIAISAVVIVAAVVVVVILTKKKKQ